MNSNSEPRRVLVVSYYYPPYASVGATRVSKMTRYLADHAWRATVLTVSGDDRPAEIDVEIPTEDIHRVSQAYDITALPRWLVGREKIQQRRFGGNRWWTASAVGRLGLLYRSLACFPDPQIGWLGPATREGLRLIEQVRPHVILSSSLPNTAHLVARRLASQTQLPWVAEMRDLWTENHNFRRYQPFRSFERRLEANVLRDADAIITVSEVWADILRARFGRPAFVVPNGFDPTDYPDPPPARPGTFTLVYTGMFYHRKQDPDPLLQAIASLSRAGTITPDTFRLQLVGYYLDPILIRAEELGVLQYVTVEAAVPYRESLRRQGGATALLFLDWAARRGQGWYSAKIYEYIGARRPILSVGPRDSVVAGLLTATGAGVAGESSQEVTAVLQGWLSEFYSTGSLACGSDPAQLTRYERQTAAATMAGILNQYARH